MSAPRQSANYVVLAGPPGAPVKFLAYATVGSSIPADLSSLPIMRDEDGTEYIWLRCKNGFIEESRTLEREVGFHVEVHALGSPSSLRFKVPDQAPFPVLWENAISAAREFAKICAAAAADFDGRTSARVVKGGLRVVAHSELVAMELPPLRWLVQGMLPEGVCLLGGGAKAGKTTLAFQVAVAVATGRPLFGLITVARTGVLYVSMEEGLGLLQRRARRFGGQGDVAGLYWTAAQQEWPHEPDARITMLDGWLKENPQVKLVILDLLGLFLPLESNRKHDYDSELKRMGRIVTLARRRGITILLIHHARKKQKGDSETDFVEDMLGSQALGGSADVIWTLNRPRKKRVGTLDVTGREVETTSVALVQRADGFWENGGDAEEDEETLGPEGRSVLDALALKSPQTLKELRERTGSIGGYTLTRLVQAGRIERPERGVYALPKVGAPPATSATSATTARLEPSPIGAKDRLPGADVPSATMGVDGSDVASQARTGATTEPLTANEVDVAEVADVAGGAHVARPSPSPKGEEE